MMNLILGNQLFPEWANAAPGDEFLMIESRAMSARYRYHQQKLVLIFASMRRHAEMLRERGFTVHYLALNEGGATRDYFSILDDRLEQLGCREVRIAEVADRGFARALEEWSRRSGVSIVSTTSRLFLTPTPLYLEAFGTAKPFMKTFYQWQRKRLKVLVDSRGEPTGGRWSFDEENRKKLPKEYRAPEIPQVPRCRIVSEVIELIRREFPDHPGNAADFWLPTDAVEAREWFEHFLKDRFDLFGPYEDALKAGEDPEDDILHHSALSPLMNIGLLPAEYVLKRTLAVAQVKKVRIESVEGFLRQVIGWREFVKGIDHLYGDRQSELNFFGHRRRLKACWYDGTTGLLPLDSAIRKANRRGYNHHIERLMIVSNAMLLSEVDPVGVHRWFMEMYVDSSEWVMGPNVYGMGQFSDGGLFATKPYICGSNYILKMSDYRRGEWCEIWDALYWNFVDRHLDFFVKNPRMGMAGNLVMKMPAERRANYAKIADSFRERTTENQ
jgi:deoxyribodipyrimidine photolyase-related protein